MANIPKQKRRDRERLMKTFMTRVQQPPPRARLNVKPRFVPVDQGYAPDKMVSTNPFYNPDPTKRGPGYGAAVALRRKRGRQTGIAKRY